MYLITIKKVYLRNFISHKETMLSFDRGVTALVGRNGAGKSSIVEAIYFALTGDVLRGESRRGGRSKRGVINDYTKENEAVVKLWLDVDGEEVIIERRCFRSSIQARPVDNRVLRNGRTVAIGASEVDKEVSKLLGVSTKTLKEVVRSALVIPQGEVTSLLESRPSDRKSRIDKVLGLENYEKAKERLDNYSISIQLSNGTRLSLYPKRNSLEDLRTTYLNRLSELSSRNEELRKLIKEVDELRKLINELRKKKEDVEGKLSKLESDRDRVKSEYERLKALSENVDELKRKLSEKRRAREEIVSELNECVNAEKKLRKISEKLKIKDLVSKAKELEDQRREVESRLREVNVRIDHLRGKLEELKELRRKYPEGIEEALNKFRKAREELGRLKAEREDLEGRERELSNLVTRLDTEVRGIKERINSVLRRASEVVSKEFSNIHEALKEVNSTLSRVESEVNELSNEVVSVRSEIESLSRDEDDIKGKLRYLRSTGELSKCPLCQQPLTPKLRNELISKFENELSMIKLKREKLREKLRSIEARLDSIKSLRDRLRDIEGRLKELLNEEELMSSKESKLRGAKEELKRIRSKLSELRDKEVELQELIMRLGSVEDDYRRFRKLIEEGVSEELLNELVNEANNYLSRLRDIKSELSGLRGKIKEVLGTEDLTKASELVNELEREFIELSSRVSRKPRIEEQLRRVNEEIKEYEEGLRRVKEYLKRMEELSKRLKDIEERCSELKKVKEELIGELKATKERLEDRERSIKEVKELVGNLERDLKTLRDAWRKLCVLNWIRDKVFHKDGAPKLLRKELIRGIEELMRRYLEYFNLSYSDVKIDEELNIYLISGGTEVGVGKLSGGESVATSIALILSLHQAVLRGKLGFLVLDEPTVHLDEERVKDLMEIVRNFKGGGVIPQLIVVTHHNEVRDVADTVYEVTRERYSVVKEVT